MQLNLHAIIPISRANGPGRRFTIWFQGCSQECPGCFNPDTHSFENRLLIEPDELIAQITSQTDLDGITISGVNHSSRPQNC
ncbi:MAG: 4Fe-4S cluster-binding domain-containing protein [Candidatus Riflebacteria bacterium]|nr:4Fe-4S cluster-binding domain-containing protein [Candidatus Riflebacteria bacterium]